MANAQKGEVALEAGGETYRLQFTTNAMCELEEATGQSINLIIADLSDIDNPPGIRTMRVLLWAALTEHHSTLNLKDAGRICDEIGIAGVGEVIGKAFQAAFPDGDDDAGKKEASKT
jgi:hypothetical protein